MDKEKDILRKVNQTLEIMDQMEELKASPDFYQQIQYKIYSEGRKRKAWEGNIIGIFNLLSLKSIRTVMVIFLLLINFVSIFFFLAEDKKSSTQTEEYKAVISIIIEDYSLDQNTYSIDVMDKMTSRSQ